MRALSSREGCAGRRWKCHSIIGDPELHGRFAALYTTDGVELHGAAIVNWPKALLACRCGMGSGVGVQELRDKLELLLDAQPTAAL